MLSFQKRKFGLNRRYAIVGGRRLSNFWWSLVLFLGGFGFLVTGVASYFNRNLLLTNNLPNVDFFPQGFILSFYGFFALCFSFHLGFILIWQIGAGFNEFNGKKKFVRIFRWGQPGKNRRIDFKYTQDLIETIKIELVPKPALFLCIKGEKKIPLTRIGEFVPLEDLETQAAELTSLLQIPLEIGD